jgi:hypothetical protein
MPVKAIPFKPGINREKSTYAAEGGWYDCDKIRFRQGYPEKIGGWTRISEDFYLGIARTINYWTLLNGQNVRGVGTHLKFYIEQGGAYFDITPIRETTSAGDVTFSATDGSDLLTISDVAHGTEVDCFVTFSGAVSLGGNYTAPVLNQEYQVVSVIDDDTYTARPISGAVTANASDTGDGGAAVVGEYQINVASEIAIPEVGWGSGSWGEYPWGGGGLPFEFVIGIWGQSNFGEDLVFGRVGGSLYYWDATNDVTTRGVRLDSLPDASNTPIRQKLVLVSNQSRFVITFGTNEIGDTFLDQMLVRWSDQEDPANWTPSATNQAGSIRLSRGSRIIAVKQARQEILIWTDTTLYSMQYIGAPEVFSIQTVGENITILNDRSPAYVAGTAYWIGDGVFYVYDGRSEPLECDVRKYVFEDINFSQTQQVFSGTVERFHEVWWFYCSNGSTTLDKYVVYNYRDSIWYYGSLARTAWDGAAWQGEPLAATYNNNLVVHENGVDNFEDGDAEAINAYVESAQFDIDDGDRFAFVRKLFPDVKFTGSTSTAPAVIISVSPFKDSGAAPNNPLSEGGNSDGTARRTVTLPLEQYTDQLDIRTRGRQMSIKVESTEKGVQWQLGKLRLDMRPDGRRG